MESPQQLLPGNFPLSKFLVELCHELEVPATDVAKQLCFQRKEALALVSLNISHSMRQEILSTSLRVMSAWVLADMPENESRSILQIMNQGDVLSYESFAYLLVMWLRIGHPGNTSSKISGSNLLKIFRSKCLFLPKQIMEAFVGWSSSPSNMQACTKPKLEEIGLVSARKPEYLSYPSSSSSEKAKMHETYHSGERKLQLCFPGKTRKSHHFPKSASGDTSAGLALPMDFMSFFHKALKKDLELLVIGSAKLAENAGYVMEFRQHFQLLQLRHRLLSDAEAGFFFPALEARGNQQNITLLYTIDHELEFKHFSEVSLILDEMLKLQNFGSCDADLEMLHQEVVNFELLCSILSHTCQSLHKLLCDQFYRRETELRPQFREYFSVQEQEKIIASILGRINAETLQDIIPWLVSWLTPQEQQAMMSLWRKITKSTMFDDWLGEWWEENGMANVEDDSNKTCAEDGLVIVPRYLSGRALDKQCDNISNNSTNISQGDCFAANIEMLENCSLDNKAQDFEGDQHKDELSNCAKLQSNGDRNSTDKVADVTDQVDVPGQTFEFAPRSSCYENLGATNQDDLEANIRRVSGDSSLDPQMKSQLIQNLMMSRWLDQKQSLHTEEENSSNNNITGQHPSYPDPLKQTFGCKHYKRNCKLLTTCCNQLYTCIRCHDEEADHPTKRRMITKMMCMKCLVIQPITQKCSTASCNSFSMAKYYCSICKLFDDDDRKIYHCPYCNLCRVGKGIGIDYFHCMNCNACMSQSLSEHICREKCFEDNCPICHEHMFTSSIPLKALPCGHFMHSTCFKDYTCIHYICPICSKSLGDMQVYFQILDEMLAEEKVPEEYSGKTQIILCNDCEKKGSAPFHWVYHKCPYCGSYNTRLF